LFTAGGIPYPLLEIGVTVEGSKLFFRKSDLNREISLLQRGNLQSTASGDFLDNFNRAF